MAPRRVGRTCLEEAREWGADPEVRAEDVEQANPDRVCRGGSWYDSARICRSAYRYWRDPANRDWIQGFRVCLFPGPVTAAGAEAAPGRGGGARRQAAAEPERAGDAKAVDLALENFPQKRGRNWKSG
jgi:hypothetical protein